MYPMLYLQADSLALAVVVNPTGAPQAVVLVLFLCSLMLPHVNVALSCDLFSCSRGILPSRGLKPFLCYVQKEC